MSPAIPGLLRRAMDMMRVLLPSSSEALPMVRALMVSSPLSVSRAMEFNPSSLSTLPIREGPRSVKRFLRSTIRDSSR